MVEVKIMCASAIARHRFPLLVHNERNCELGKAFEEAYSFVRWKMENSLSRSDIFNYENEEKYILGRKFSEENVKDVKMIEKGKYTYCDSCYDLYKNVRFALCNIHNNDVVCKKCYLRRLETDFFNKINKKIKNLSFSEKEFLKNIMHLFIKNDVDGRTPKTRAKRIGNYIITAKPDLETGGSSEFSEFKICPIDDYAREQSRVFAWVVGKNINLFGVNKNLEIMNEIISVPESIGDLSNVTGEITDDTKICRLCNLPRCNCDELFYGHT